MSDQKILVVDASPTMRRITINTVKKVGYAEVNDAEDGRDALAKLMAGEYNLLITDWNMPNMSGIELVKQVRSEDKLKAIPILMITNRSMKEDIVSAIKAGANGYIVKPFNTNTLKNKIHEIVG